MRLLILLLFPLIVFAQTPTPTPLLVDRIGVNTPGPLVPLHFTVKYPADTTSSEELIRFTTPTGTDVNGIVHHPFQFYQRTTMFGNDRTDSVGWGFTPADQPQAAPSLAFLMEDAFAGGGPNQQFELHLQLQTPEGGGDRPWTWTFDRVNGDTAVYTSAKVIGFGTGKLTQASNGLLLTNTAFQANLLNGPFQFRGNAFTFETLDNNGASHKQVSIRPYPTDSQKSWLLFGVPSGGNGGIVGVTDGVAIKGNSLTNGHVHSGRLNAYGLNSSTTPKVVIDENVWLAAGQTFYFSPSGNAQDSASDLAINRSGESTLLVRNPLTGARATVDAVFNINTYGGGAYKVNGVSGVTVSGSECKITSITAGIITGATCVP